MAKKYFKQREAYRYTNTWSAYDPGSSSLMTSYETEYHTETVAQMAHHFPSDTMPRLHQQIVTDEVAKQYYVDSKEQDDERKSNELSEFPVLVSGLLQYFIDIGLGDGRSQEFDFSS